MKNTGKGPAHGFTLIELLVVISIVALLIAILLPALASARMSANQTKCAVGQKQIGIAYLLYGEDYEQYFPKPQGYSDWNNGSTRFMWYIGRYINNPWWQKYRGSTARYSFPPEVKCPERSITSSYHFGMNSGYTGFHWQVINPSSTILMGDTSGDYYYYTHTYRNYEFRHMDRTGTNEANTNALMGDMHVITFSKASNFVKWPHETCPSLAVKRQ
jgi:prepilin-type N-terminal cleavage/methylation domain-containing protein